MSYRLDEINHTIFEKKLIKLPANTAYLLDYVCSEYEAIISCPSQVYNSDYPNNNHFNYHNKRLKKSEYYHNHNHNHNNRADDGGLPSPPLSSPERKPSFYNKLSQNMMYISRPPTPPTHELPSPITTTPSLRDYIESVVIKSRIDTGTLLLSLSYARRLKLKLSHTSKGMECTHHRIFLATLIIATKYIHDSALKNKYWVVYAQLFSACEINLMEKQLLQLLEYNLEIKANDYDMIVYDLVKVYFKNTTSYYSQEEKDDDWWQYQQKRIITSQPAVPAALLNRYHVSPRRTCI